MAIEQHIDTVAAVANKATPVTTAVGLSTFLGIEWDIWLKVLATGHLILMFAYYSWKWRKEYQDEKRKNQEREQNGS